MADLLDIAPSTASEVVKIDGQRITVRAISFDGIASIIARFPELRSLINGGFGDDFIPRLILGCAASVGPIIAAGCGHLADEAYEQRALSLLPQQQVKFLKAIFGLSFPNGLGSFVEDLTGLMGSLTGPGEGAAKPIKMRSRNSHSVSPPLSDEASHPTMQ
jgi:hypothetical protein